MIPVSAAMQANINSQTPHLSIAWLIVRTDGQRFAFTSWDIPFSYSIDGVNTDTYEPINSMDGTANAAKVDLSVQNGNTTTIYSKSLTERDLNGGLFDDARVKIFWIDPSNTSAGVIPIQGGRLGEMTFKNVSFDVELRGASQVLQQSYGRTYTLECYTDYGSQYCQHLARARIWRPQFKFVNRTSYNIVVRPRTFNGYWYTTPASGGWTGATEPTWPTSAGGAVVDGEVTWTCINAPYSGGTVRGVFNRAKFSDPGRGEAQNYWQYGQIMWLTGQNAGLQMEINGFDAGGVVYLLESMPAIISPGDTYVLLDGCEKTRVACLRKGNLLNFQGFPDMPTEEQALATPNMAQPDNVQPQKSSGS